MLDNHVMLGDIGMGQLPISPNERLATQTIIS